MNKKLINVLVALSLTIALVLLIVIMTNSLAPGSTGQRIGIMLGGTLPEGFIQTFCYFLFFFALLEIRQDISSLKEEQKAFDLQILPEQEQYVLSSDDVNDIKLKTVELLKSRPSILLETIKKACTKFRANKSVSETMDLLSSQTNINLLSSDSRQSMIRYAAWAIPSVGFIGTVIGIATSLGLAKDVVSQEGIDNVTSALSVAFDTTLVALILSIILTFFIHRLQESSESFHTNVESYILENLINRIYHR